MPDEFEQQEYEEIKKRRRSFGNLFKNLTGWQFFSVLFLVFVFFYLLSEKNSNKFYYIFILSSIIVIIFYSQKQESTNFISMENAKRLAKEALENRKEEYEIERDANITTGFCRLEKIMGRPEEWHIAVKVETEDKLKKHWRVDLNPYTGGITGIVNKKYDGTEILDKEIIHPDHYYKESG